jgi:hypothetical protein
VTAESHYGVAAGNCLAEGARSGGGRATAEFQPLKRLTAAEVWPHSHGWLPADRTAAE